MQMTIGKKLIISFLVLAMLVLLSGIVGFFVLNKSADSADSVAKGKAPIQYSVMNGALALETVQKSVAQYTASNTGIEEIGTRVVNGLDAFDMWITMIRFGTESNEFQKSKSGTIYKNDNLKIEVQKGSGAMQGELEKILTERDTFRNAVFELMESHNTSETYTVLVGDKYYTLVDFLNFAQIDHLNWVRQLKDAVNIETTFNGNTDPSKGIVGEWLHSSYQVENEEFSALIGKLKKQHNKLLSMAVKINTKEKYKEKQRLFNRGIAATAKMEKYFGEMHKLSSEIYKKLDSAEGTRQKVMIASADTINALLDGLVVQAAKEMKGALQTAENVKNKGTWILVFITLAAVVVAGVLGTLISRFLAGRIGALAEATRKISQGDLQNTLDITSNDELGALADDTNSMIKNLRIIIGQILTISGNLTGSSRSLAGISDNLEGNARDLSNKAGNATSATADMSESMLEISTTANDSMLRVNNVAQATEEMTATINEIAKNTEQARTVSSKAVETVEKTTSKMTELSEAAREIGAVADVIVDIADQTNLLSLNATIEAARAGEAGKGFAVVANEVKELASQTNKATEDIRNKIIAIQQSSNMTISEIEEIASVINNINSIVVVIAGAVEEQAVTTQQIAEDIGSVSSGIENMTGNVDSASAIAESVSEDIAAVNSTSVVVQGSSGEIGSSATELATLAEELQVLVGKFQL